MKNISRCLIIVVLFLSNFPAITFANDSTYFDLPTAFDMAAPNVTYTPNPQIDSIIQFVVQFTSNITGYTNITTHFPGAIAPWNQAPNETSRDSMFWADSGSTYTCTFPMKIFGDGGSLLEAYVRPSTPRHDLNEIAATSVQIINGATFLVIKPGDHYTDSNSYSFSPMIGGYPLHMHIHGKVDYKDAQQSGSPLKGAYGARVVLLFHKTCTSCPCEKPTTLNNLSHPVGGCIEGTHWAKVDVNGDFTFDFWTTGTQYWNQSYYDAHLFVTNWNDAVLLTPNDGANQSRVNASKITGASCDWSVFTGDAFTKCLDIHNSANTNILSFNSGIKITLPNTDGIGSALRNAEFSQDFYRDRPVGSLIPDQIPVLIYNYLGYNHQGGVFNKGCICIKYNAAVIPAAVIDHEWGHYAQFILWGDGIDDGAVAGNLIEAWPNFYQFAVRNYATALYGEDIIGWMSNPEEAPFYTPRWGHYTDANKNDIFDAGDTPLTPFIDYEVTASFLWNLYDTYTDVGFKAPIYDDADNDDISEQSLFFSTMPASPTSPQTTSEQQYLVDLQAQVGSDEAISMQKIYDCMYGPSHNGLSPTIKMRPAQIKDLTGNGIASSGPFHTFLDWNSQEYTTTWNTDWTSSIPFKNPRDGVHIYQSDGSSGWDDIYPCCVQYGIVTSSSASFDPDLTSYYDFMVSTYDDDGDAWNGQTISPIYSDKILIGEKESNAGSNFSFQSASPNPFKDEFTIKFELEGKASIGYEVLNALGVAMLSGSKTYDAAGAKAIQVNGSSLPAGMYIVRLFIVGSIGKPSYETFKIVKAD